VRPWTDGETRVRKEAGEKKDIGGGGPLINNRHTVTDNLPLSCSSFRGRRRREEVCWRLRSTGLLWENSIQFICRAYFHKLEMCLGGLYNLYTDIPDL